MSAQRRAASKRHSGGGRPRAAKARTTERQRPVDVAVEAQKPVKPGPPRSSQIGRAGRRLVSLERTEGLRRYTRETYAEMKKINWPDQETTRNLTLVVIAVSAVLGVVLGGIDFVLFRLFEALS